jgi:Flp pilus assembly protein protease CpaA
MILLPHPFWNDKFLEENMNIVTIAGICKDALFVSLLIWCSVSDLRKREIPNAAILLMLGLAAVHLIGAIILGLPWYVYPPGALFAAPFFFGWRKGLFGGGDVKLLFATGLYLGVCLTLITFEVMLAVCTALLISRAVRRSGVRVRLPLAPVLSLGAAAAVALSYLI